MPELQINQPHGVGCSCQAAYALRPDDLPSKDRGGGCRTVPLLTYARGATTFLNGTTLFEPGASIAHHRHNVVESVMVVQGTAVVDIDGERVPLRTWDTTVVPANVDHHFENASATAPMRIFWTYGSVDANRTIAATGEVSRIDGEAPGDESAGPGSSDAGSAPTASSTSAVTEVVELHVTPGAEAAFEAAVAEAAALFQRSVGARTLELSAQVEDPTTYLLLVRWETIEDHLEGFRSSAAYARWRELVLPHLTTPPVATHYRHRLSGF